MIQKLSCQTVVRLLKNQFDKTSFQKVISSEREPPYHNKKSPRDAHTTTSYIASKMCFITFCCKNTHTQVVLYSFTTLMQFAFATPLVQHSIFNDIKQLTLYVNSLFRSLGLWWFAKTHHLISEGLGQNQRNLIQS